MTVNSEKKLLKNWNINNICSKNEKNGEGLMGLFLQDNGIFISYWPRLVVNL